MHLRYDYYDANMAGEMRHAQKVMRELGITYQHSTPQSLVDSWWFWNCENIPSTLPGYLSELNADPMECIGCGLSKENAELIASYSKD